MVAYNYYWDYLSPTLVGCSFGGTLQFEATDTGDKMTLSACAMVQNFALSGSGENDFDAETFTLVVSVSAWQMATSSTCVTIMKAPTHSQANMTGKMWI
jgi:hypothetical protein